MSLRTLASKYGTTAPTVRRALGKGQGDPVVAGVVGDEHQGEVRA